MAKTIVLRPTATAATATTSGPVLLDGIFGYSIQAAFTGSNVVGTLKLLVSADGVNYIDLVSSSQAITASAGYVYNLSDVQYKYVKADWAYTSGTGNLTITFYTKFGDK